MASTGMPAAASAAPQTGDGYPYTFWGYMFLPNKAPSPMLRRLLLGLTACIADEMDPHDSNDLTPSQMAAFYRSVGGNYDPLFKDTPHSSIAFIYRALGCLHSLQPETSRRDMFSPPTVPSLKPFGFVTWQSIQLLLGPHEHVPFIQAALQRFDVRDPDTGHLFPKTIPTQCLPQEPDQDMLNWHHTVRNRLEKDALQSPVVDRPAGFVPAGGMERPGSSDSITSQSTAEERADAARFFGRPGLSRNLHKAQQGFKTGSQMVLNTAKQMANPLALWNMSERSESKDRTRRSRERGSSRDAKDHVRRKSMPDRVPSSDDRRYDSAASDYPERRRTRARFADQSPGRAPPATKHSRHPSDSRADPESRRPTSRRYPSDESYSSAENERRRPLRPQHSMRRYKSYDPPPSPRTYQEEGFGNPHYADGRSPPYSPSQMRSPYNEYGGQPSMHHRPRASTGVPLDARSDPRFHGHVRNDPRRGPSPRRQSPSRPSSTFFRGNDHVRPSQQRGDTGRRFSNRDHVTFEGGTDDGQTTPGPNTYQEYSTQRRVSQPSPNVHAQHRWSNSGRHPRFEPSSQHLGPRANDYFSERPDGPSDDRLRESRPQGRGDPGGSLRPSPNPERSSPGASLAHRPRFDNAARPSGRSPKPPLSPRYGTPAPDDEPPTKPPRPQQGSAEDESRNLRVADPEREGAATPKGRTASSGGDSVGGGDRTGSRALVLSRQASPASGKPTTTTTTTSAKEQGEGEDDDRDDLSEWWDEESEIAVSESTSATPTASGVQERKGSGPASAAAAAAAAADHEAANGGNNGGTAVWNEGAAQEAGAAAAEAGDAPAAVAPPRGRRPPTMQKQVSAVGGVRGRAYPKEFSWR